MSSGNIQFSTSKPDCATVGGNVGTIDAALVHAPSSGVNRNYASSTPPVSADACNPVTQQTGVSHGAHVFQRDEAGAWTR